MAYQEIQYSNADITDWGNCGEFEKIRNILGFKFIIPKKFYSKKQWVFLNKALHKIIKENKKYV